MSLYRWGFLLSCSDVTHTLDFHCKVASNRRSSAAANGRHCGTVRRASDLALPTALRWSQWVDHRLNSPKFYSCCNLHYQNWSSLLIATNLNPFSCRTIFFISCDILYTFFLSPLFYNILYPIALIINF